MSIILLTSVYAQRTTIQGIILDSNTAEPLIGANIILDGTILGSASDINGEYLISDIPFGNYTLKAMFIGYEILEQKIQVEAGELYTINLSLKPSAIELQETKVTAEKRKGKVTEAPASIEIITSRDIKRETTTNMGSYLKGLKGVDFTSSGINNYSISIRGFNSSFNTRVLTLTDGRVANIPALRVINYSTVPQSMDDIDKMEVVLGPATALYGANAHSGVVNIISKSPAHSEGLTMSVSGSNDERQLRKINGRWAKKLSNSFSIKLSGMYLHAYEWPYISESEYKSHLYPWTGHPYRMFDGKDNNPWTGPSSPPDSAMNNSGVYVRIGDGEANHGDWDGDGVAGEDWWNGYDDDGDCPGDTNQDGCKCCSGDAGVDEDYFTADGIDNDDDCPGDTNQDGCKCCSGDAGVDEFIDTAFDVWTDGYDNDGNGDIDDGREMFNNDSGTNFDPEWQYNLEERQIIVKGGRKNTEINGEPNPWYIEGATLKFADLRGNMKYDEKNVRYIFDVFNYDYGDDGIPGDPWQDLGGDGEFQKGECLSIFGGLSDACDVGLDGEANTDDPGEGDGKWQPGDGWIDTNNNNYLDEEIDKYITPNDNDYNDVWPPPNGVWDSGEDIFDCGQDGLCPGDDGYTGKDTGEDGILVAWDTGEMDGVFDTGDGLFNQIGDQFDDVNGNGRWDQGETLLTDENGDGQYTPPDYVDNFQYVDDVNGDGISDYPDFEVENRKLEYRIDYDPNPNINLTLQGGYSWTKTQQVTGTSRYLADGFEYRFYQLRGRFYNWFSQFYMNQSFSGNTRSYNLGNVVDDKSKNYAFQLQHNDEIPFLSTELVWGFDYFKTLPSTNGTILNDGPNGYDNDGDNIWIGYDGIDQDGTDGADDEFCPDGTKSGRRDGRLWECYEGIDEPDEWDDPESNEYGGYYQSKSELFGTSRYELITAARWDYHDLLAEGIQFAPKLGFIFRPDEKSSFRFTYGKAFNTPNSITLYTDLFVRKQGIMDVYLRGNKDGTPYCHVGDPCSGVKSASANSPGFYKENGEYHSISPLSDDYFTGNDDVRPYNERVQGAPYFFNLSDSPPIDMIPLDTSRYLVYIPELNGDGVLYTPMESFNIPDVNPIKTEKIQTVEMGYKGFLGRRTHITLDYYLSFYEDFFSPPTFITPTIVIRGFDSNENEIRNIDSLSIAGIMPVNSFGANAPYSTAWNGLDDDGDWDLWADEFEWRDDDDGDCPPGAAANHSCYADKGEWGFIDWITENNPVTEKTDTIGYNIYHPSEVVIAVEGGIDFKSIDPDGNPIDPTFFQAVGVDEYHATVGLNEAEMILTGLTGSNGEQLYGPGLAYSPPHLVLSPMNYGEVWMQGLDMGITHFLPEYGLVIDGNMSWYGTTEFYNELTKKNDPINAPQWKWNTSVKWDTPMGNLTFNYRHVDQFKWSDGIWAGVIGPYNIYDMHYNYKITENLEFSISALNIMDDRHKELIGGAIMGRQLITRMTSTF